MSTTTSNSPTAGRKVEAEQIWEHVNGNQYIVLFIANEHSEHPGYRPIVVYRGENGKVWARPLSAWHRSMFYIGVVPR